MTGMRCLLASFIAFATACSTEHVQQSHEPPIQNLAVTRKLNRTTMTETITASTPGGIVTASARLRRYHPHEETQTPRHWIGFGEISPDLVLADLSLVVAGKPVSIPRSCYADFGEFGFSGASLDLASDGEQVILHYSGGDGAASYYADFVVRDARLEEIRIHTLGPLPDKRVGRITMVRSVPPQ